MAMDTYETAKTALRSITDIVEQTEKMRQASYSKFCIGQIEKKGELEALAESIKMLSETLSPRMDFEEKKWICEAICRGEFSDIINEEIINWEEEIRDCVAEIEKEYRYCNICGKRVMYLPKTEYYRKEQREHGFPHWDKLFESIGRLKCTCPVCKSMDRERMLALFLDMLRPEKGKKLKVLQIAPSSALDGWLRRRDDINYDTTDLMMPFVSFRSDIQNMDMVEDGTYDIVICSHVLEHVEDDRKAMAELRRILKDDGVCLFLVPMVIGLDKTDEEFGLSKGENWSRFGQDDHARLYAREDFLGRLTGMGFMVHVLSKDYFGKEFWKQAGLSDIHYLYAATKQDIGIGIEPYQIAEEKEELISVVIPTHNRGYCIERAIQSVLNQTYKNLELIVVDDASFDDTEERVKRYGDERIRYIKLEDNRGANYARNVGIKAARGDYVAFNDSDDEWLLDKLEKQMKLLKLEERIAGKKIGVVYCMMTTYRNGEILEVVPNTSYLNENLIGDIYYYMQGNFFISTQTLLIRKDVFENVGYFNEELKRLQDWELLLRIAQKYNFTFVQESLVNVYEQEDCISRNERGWIDTVLYVQKLHHMAETNKQAYKKLLKIVLRKLKRYPYPTDYLEEKMMQIERQGFFTKAEIQNMKVSLGIK